jgi:hypothetical protein
MSVLLGLLGLMRHLCGVRDHVVAKLAGAAKHADSASSDGATAMRGVAAK